MKNKVFVVLKEEKYILDRVVHMEDVVFDSTIFRQEAIDRAQEIVDFELDEEEYERFRELKYNGVESKDGTVSIMITTRKFVKKYMKHTLKTEIELWETDFFERWED